MDGVIAVKDEMKGEHPDTKIDNLKVWIMLNTLKSKGLVD